MQVDYLRALRRRWRVVLLTLILVGAAAAAMTVLTPKKYSSTVQFFVSTEAPAPSADNSASSAYQGSLFSQERVKSYADVLTNRETSRLIVSDLNLRMTPDELRRQITASPVTGTVLLRATVTDRSAARAYEIAGAIARMFPSRIAALESPGGTAAPVRVNVVEPPVQMNSPVSPRPVRNGVLALILGLFLGMALAALRERLDSRVSDPSEIEKLVEAPVLSVVPVDPSARRNPIAVGRGRHGVRLEAYKRLRTNLQFVQTAGEVNTLMVTSPMPRDGKSTTTLNLAISLAEAGQSVVLVEADLRRPQLADYLGLEGAVGLTDVLIGRVALEDALQTWGEGGLQVLLAGPTPPNPSELLGAPVMKDLVHVLKRRGAIVVFDTPPLLPVTDAAVISAHCDAALLVLNCGQSTKEQASFAAASLRRVNAKLAGVILNRVRNTKTDAAYYGYGAYPSNGKALDNAEAAATVLSTRRVLDEQTVLDEQIRAEAITRAYAEARVDEVDVTESTSASLTNGYRGVVGGTTEGQRLRQD